MNKLPLRVDVNISRTDLRTWLEQPLQNIDTAEVNGICLDSRVLKKGDIFIALKAARDGHEFVEAAISKGASAVIVDHDVKLKNQIIVSDTLQALFDLAKKYRECWRGTVVGVSGSNGKTTTKEILHTILGDHVFATPGTWNNHLGIPLSIFMLRPVHKIAILEMGINNHGDIRGYAEYTKPDIGVLTVIGDSHLMNLKNKEGVCKAKGELFEALPETGIAVINIDDPYLQSFQTTLEKKMITVSLQLDADIMVKNSPGEDKVKIKYGEEAFETRFQLQGRHNLSNLACALGVALACKTEISILKKKIPTMAPLELRMQEYQTNKGIRIILDCYNANPTSTRAGLEMIAGKKERKVVLLGDMLELGDTSSKIHMDLAKQLYDLNINLVFFIGQFAKDYYQGALLGGLDESNVFVLEDRKKAHEKIRAHLQTGDILYVKGSRGMRLEEIVEPLL